MSRFPLNCFDLDTDNSEDNLCDVCTDSIFMDLRSHWNFSEKACSSTIEQKMMKDWLHRSLINPDHNLVQSVIRDLSSLTTGANFIEQLTLTFDPLVGNLSIGAQSAYDFEVNTQYANIFQKIQHPKRHIDTFPTPSKDCRFYLNIKAPAGLIFKYVTLAQTNFFFYVHNSVQTLYNMFLTFYILQN